MKTVRKQEITQGSILEAINKGAKSFTQIARAHGYVGSVSSNVTAKIRTLVPDVVDRLAGKVKTVSVAEVPVKPVVSTVKPVTPSASSIPVVAQSKGVYRGMYGVVFDKAVKAGEVAVKEFIPKAATEIASDPTCEAVVAKIKAKIGDADLVAALTKAVTFAIGVIRTPQHQSNKGKSRNASTVRGHMLIEATEA
jgi:hypothetical protein